MNFKISKKEFLDALSLSSRAISTTTPLPSLSGIKISASENSLVLVSSDSNISIRTSINNNDSNALIINEPGEIVLDSRYILEIVRKIDSDFINVETIDGTLVKIYGGNSEFKVNGMEANEYPNISFDVRDSAPFKLETTLFNQIIDETAFACSDKETRPVLTGVNFSAKNKKLFANATDSYRLASKTIDIDRDLNFNITVPAKYLNEVYHSIAGEKEVTIAIDSQKISFIFGNTIIDTRLLDDEFPDTSRLVPTSFTQKLTVSSREMIRAIDRTLFIKSDGKNTIKMNIDADKIELTSSNQSMISSFEEIKVISYEGNPLEISCSGKYLQDAIKAIGSDEITINFSGELKPMVVKREGDDSLIQLISPVRTYR
ncbi:MAG: DNA polymerase III subunit beta [Erysipelotrichaceae bacterium]|nr:DNA polymerase III subunit beta [Erysipelotrichaceae bacterium]